MQIIYVPLTQINEPYDPSRLKIDQVALQELIDSIKERGLLQPILLKRSGERYEIEAGHRRFLSLKQLNWEQAPSIILGDTDENDLHIERAHENLIRENLSVIEEAKMVNMLVNENGRGIDETSRLIKRTIAWIQGRLDLLYYPEEIREALSESKINITVAKALSKCRNADYRKKLLDYVIETGATATVVSRWVSDSTVEDFTNALEQSKVTGFVQQIDLGPTFMQCGICVTRYPTDQLRHVFLCPTCMHGIAQIRQDYSKENDQEVERH